MRVRAGRLLWQGDACVAGTTPRAVGAGRICVTLAAALLFFGSTISPAFAHDSLVGTEPSDGAVVRAPGGVVLTFAADQLAVGAVVVVIGPDGQGWADGNPVVSGPRVTQPLKADLPGGSYEVNWRSVSGDGHPVEGAFRFEVEAPAAPSASEPPATTARTTGPSTDQPSPAAASPAAGDGEEQRAANGQDASGLSGLAVAGGVLVAGVIAVGLVYVLGRRRASRTPQR